MAGSSWLLNLLLFVLLLGASLHVVRFVHEWLYPEPPPQTTLEKAWSTVTSGLSGATNVVSSTWQAGADCVYGVASIFASTIGAPGGWWLGRYRAQYESASNPLVWFFTPDQAQVAAQGVIIPWIIGGVSTISLAVGFPAAWVLGTASVSLCMLSLSPFVVLAKGLMGVG